MIKKHFAFLLCSCLFIKCSAQYDWALDSLKKYSYVLVDANYTPQFPDGLNNISNYTASGNATGFFIKVDKKLFLISAYHVLTGFDVFNGRYVEGRGKFMMILYGNDKFDNHTRFRTIENSILRNSCGPPGFYNERPDIDLIDITAYFSDSEVNMIKTLPLSLFKTQVEKNVNKSIISYGFPGYLAGNYSDWRSHAINVKAAPYFARLSDSTSMDSATWKNTATFDVVTSQFSIKGVSGSPAFYYCTKGKKKWIEFAGVMSGSNYEFNLAFIARKEFLNKALAEKGITNYVPDIDKKKHR